MATIITRTVNGAGPYAYRAEYVDGRHKWTYLGPVDDLDLDDLDTDDVEQSTLDDVAELIMHARSVKGRLQNVGVDDWLAFYDPTLEVEEHDPEAARRDESGARSDADDTEGTQLQREAEAFRRAESEAEDHARQGCIEGHEEACQELKRLGWADAETRELEEYTEPETFARVVNDERKRAEAPA